MREYLLVSWCEADLHRWCVVSHDIANPHVWVVIESFPTAHQATEYIREVRARQRLLATVG